MLIERGQHPLIARGISHWIMRLGEDEAKKARMQRIVVDALRFLAKPGRAKRSISRRAAALLELWNTTSDLGNVFDAGDVSVFEFEEALEGALRGDIAAYRRVTDAARMDAGNQRHPTPAAPKKRRPGSRGAPNFNCQIVTRRSWPPCPQGRPFWRSLWVSPGASSPLGPPARGRPA